MRDLRDLITHAKKVKLILPELIKKCPELLAYDESGKALGFSQAFIAKLDTRHKGTATVTHIRCETKYVKMLAELKSIAILADVPVNGDLLKALSKKNAAIYYSVYDRTLHDVKDEKGKLIATITPPPLLGGFA